MRKEVGFAIVAVSLILVLSVSLVSAGWFSDFFDNLFGTGDKITGMVVGGSCVCTAGCEIILESTECSEGYEPNCISGPEDTCTGCVCEFIPGEEDCTSGVCCNAEEGTIEYGTFKSPGTECTIPEVLESQYQCTDVFDLYSDTDCGEELQEKTEYKVKECTGSSADCSTTYEYYLSDWTTIATCTDDENCDLENNECQEVQVCSNPTCGDGAFNQPYPLEECDDGDTDNTDDCLMTCRFPKCGDTVVWAGHEECDDDWVVHVDGDGCSADCDFEYCGDGIITTTDPNGYYLTGGAFIAEECDDGNNIDNDGCSATCELEAYCGDGIVNQAQGIEDCDDENNVDSDGCSADCKYEECGDEIITTTDPNGYYQITGDFIAEECDGTNFGEATCLTQPQGFDDGTLGCDAACQFDISGCEYSSCDGEWNEADDVDGNECDDDNDIGCVNCVCDFSEGYLPNTPLAADCIPCDRDGDEVLDDTDVCSFGGDCDDLNAAVNPSMPEFGHCDDGIDNDCDGLTDWANGVGDGDCDDTCIDSDNDGWGAESCDGSDCNDANASINPGADEACGSEVDYDCDGNSYNGCAYYSINGSVSYIDEAYENAIIPFACLFELMNSNGERILGGRTVDESCVIASIGGDFSECNYVADNPQSNGLYYRSFKCNTGAVEENKPLVCAVNLDCNVGTYQTSNILKINVTAPFPCPEGSSEKSIRVEVEDEAELESETFETGDSLNLELSFRNDVSLTKDLSIQARLYEVNSQQLVKSYSNEVSVEGTIDLDWALDLPLTIIDSGNYRLYLKVYRSIDDICILKSYDLNLEEGVISAIDVDFRTTTIGRVRGGLHESKTFTLDGGIVHNLEIKTITSNSVTVTITSDPIDVTLSKGDSEEVDLNDDGEADIKITLQDIISGEAVIDLESLGDLTGCVEGNILPCGASLEGTKICSSGIWSTCSHDNSGASNNNVDTESYTGPDTDSNGKTSKAWLYILIGIIIVGIIVVIFIIKTKLSQVEGGPPARQYYPPQGRPPVGPPLTGYRR